jgi:hypothetical protein
VGRDLEAALGLGISGLLARQRLAAIVDQPALGWVVEIECGGVVVDRLAGQRGQLGADAR